MGIKETANTFHLSRNTVRKYVRLFISSGKTTEQLLELSEEHLREMFGCTEFRHREPSQRQLELDALIPGYVARLSRKGMTVRKLFNEYRSEHPDGFQESVFKRSVRQYRFHTTVVGHVEHYAADQMYVDFAGDKLEVVDGMTGEVKKAEVSVAILPFSHYTYCEAVWSQRKEDLIKACQNAFEYFGGVTASKLLGQLKVAKVKNNLEPELKKIERCQLLIPDDLFLVPLDAKERPILLDIIEDRNERKSTIITSRYPSSSWYDMVGDPTVADAILDRIVHSAHTIELSGESMRKLKAGKA